MSEPSAILGKAFMIRDPSDGTVREKAKLESGLPTASAKPKDVERLEKSREWLKSYKLGFRPEDGPNA